MPVKRWLPILVVLVYFGLMLQVPFILALATTIFVLLGLAAWWSSRALQGVSYTRRFHYTRAFPGEKFPVRIEVMNDKLLPLSWLRIEDSWPKPVGPEDESILAPTHAQEVGYLTHALSLRWFERIRRNYLLTFRKRGIYRVGPVKMESGDLFGIYVQEGHREEVETLTVFPQLAPLDQTILPPAHPFGEQRSPRRLFEDPTRPMGVREYHPEDGFRRVHWPATARTGNLQVKVYQPTAARVTVLCLNVSTYHRYWEGVYPALLEHLLSVAAALVTRSSQEGQRVGMISNGCLSNSDQPFRILPGSSPQQLSHLLQALAGVTPVVVAPFERFLMREIPRVPYGASLVVLTAVTSLELAETLLSLKRHERQISLVSLAEGPPAYMPGIRVVHMPFKED